jgi:hypothetical protein
MSEAEVRYRDEIASDVRAMLGAGIELDSVEVDMTAATIAATYHLGELTRTTVGRGETVVEAHADLRAHLVEDRIGIGYQALIG